MRALGPFPVRRIAAFGTAAACTYLGLANYYASMAQQDAYSWGFGAPPPPTSAFGEAFLAAPGLLAGLPLIITGAALGVDWLTHSGIVLGATFFWYCVGWYVDCARDMLDTDKPPRVISGYMSALVVVSAVIFPFAVLLGLNLGPHFCANGAPPYWSAVLMFGICMFWVTLGVFFGWRRFQRWRERRRASTVFQV